jgi:hypothetical protein
MAATIEPSALSYTLLCCACGRSRDLAGLRVTLPERACCGVEAIVTLAEGDAAYELRCAICNSRGEPLPPVVVSFLRDTVRVFGTPTAPIFLTRAMYRKGPKMNRNDLFPSKYFKAADLNGQPIVLTIKTATVETMKNMQGGSDEKLVLKFVNHKKALVVNRTNYDAIADGYGDETDGWLGEKVLLFPDKARVGGKTVDCVRVRIPGEANDEIAL